MRSARGKADLVAYRVWKRNVSTEQWITVEETSMEWYLIKTKSDGSMNRMRTRTIEDIQEAEVLVVHLNAIMIEDEIAGQIEIRRSTVHTIKIVIDIMTAVETMMKIDIG